MQERAVHIGCIAGEIEVPAIISRSSATPSSSVSVSFQMPGGDAT